MADVANLKAAFDKYGVPYKEHDAGWASRGRPYTFEPKGVVFHHDASGKGPSDGVDDFIVRGTSTIPGPLAQMWASRAEGRPQIHLLAGGRANHAGRGGGSSADPDARWIPTDSGNRYTVGLEWDHTANETVDAEVYSVCVHAMAAICLYNGWPVSRVVGHKEYAPGRKIDPWGVTMEQVRTDVAAKVEQLKGVAPVAPTPKPKPVPKPTIPVPAPSTGTPSLRNLVYGRRNGDIRTLQNQLRAKGYSRYNPNGATGYYGNETKAMVAAFQRAQGWSGSGADGLMGPKTLAALFSSAPAPAKPAPKPSGVSLSNLRYGLRNDDVKKLQLALRARAFKYRNLNPSGATGYYGAETKAMVRRFQLDQGWRGSDANGIPGPETIKRLGLA